MDANVEVWEMVFGYLQSWEFLVLVALIVLPKVVNTLIVAGKIR